MMTTYPKKPFYWLMLSATLWLLGCQTPFNFDEPPEILYGEDSCIECSMIIADPRFAAAYVTSDEQVRLFDDIGDMLAYSAKSDEQVAVYWVHDFETQDWTPAASATFVLNREIQSPMGWGLAAFSTPAAAAAYQAHHGGELAQLTELQARIASGAIDPEQLHAHVSHSEAEHDDSNMPSGAEHDHNH